MLVNAWYQGSSWLVVLKPLAALFRWLADKRRHAYQAGMKEVWNAPVPVIVSGNITVGGVGKTPLVAALTRIARDAGYKPGIVSRGYGGQAPHYPYTVQTDSTAREVGDEPLMLARRTLSPVVVDADRVAAVKHLLATTDCDLVISDDGLQHYALGRDLEIAVVDGQRGLGNGQFIPAGPLREPPERLQQVDWVVVNGDGFEVDDKMQRMYLEPTQLVNLLTGERKPAAALAQSGEVHAIAGIGYPQRFFNTLQKLGYRVHGHAFNDHHVFESKDLPADDGKAIIMTEKDAVKCEHLADQRCWYLEVSAQLDPHYVTILQRQLKDLTGLKKLTGGLNG